MILIFIGLIASIIGAISGIGGGVIIKPVLDATTNLDASVISFLSTCAVFSMSVAAVIKYMGDKTPIDKGRTVLLGGGAIVGGFAGTWIFNLLIQAIGNDRVIKLIQNTVLFIILVVIVFYINNPNKRQFMVNNSVFIVCIGIVLGIISAFLGIGGGPINIAVLTFFFSMDLKVSTINSIVLILFSQSSKILTVILSNTTPNALEPWMLLCIIPACIVGGIIGTIINKIISKEKLKLTYNVVMSFVILTCLWNIIRLF